MPFIAEAYLDTVSTEKRTQLLRTHVPLGYHPETHDQLLLPDHDRYAGTYVLGVQGVGKSALLENLISFDHAAGNAVIVIDPHGDLTTHCLAELPLHRLASAYLLDMEDEAYPFGVNAFSVGKLDTSIAQAQAVERIMHIFEVLWADVLSQQHLPRYVRAATITFLANPGVTLVDMHAFLLDDIVRQRMLNNVSDLTVRQFWQSQYDSLPEAERARRVQPLVGRLEALFMGRSLVRNIVGQRVTTINFRTAIGNKEVIFIRLPIKAVAQDARLIGTMLMAQIHAAVFSFANMPEAKRPGVSLYIDEFQVFSTPDIAELFTEGRKFGVKLTVAHQYRNQLPKYLQDSTMTARTKVCFQITPEDGREMSHVFPAQDEGIKPEDIEAHLTEHLLTYGSDNIHINQLIDTYLRPLQSQKRGGKVDIEGAQLVFDLWNGAKMREVYVADPTPYLDTLLYHAMKDGDGTLPIPREVVQGFANCGRGFFGQVRGIAANDPSLLTSAKFPPALVVQTANGGFRWTRAPESSMEQFFHLLFHLRMTMLYVAEAPIGKKSTPSSTVVGQMLTNLPRRAAFVRSAETVGVIYTEDTPRRITGAELVKRVQTILTQTRQKYCHPRAEVEHMFQQPSGDAVPTPQDAASTVSQPTRWEEV